MAKFLSVPPTCPDPTQVRTLEGLFIVAKFKRLHEVPTSMFAKLCEQTIELANSAESTSGFNYDERNLQLKWINAAIRTGQYSLLPTTLTHQLPLNLAVTAAIETMGIERNPLATLPENWQQAIAHAITEDGQPYYTGPSDTLALLSRLVTVELLPQTLITNIIDPAKVGDIVYFTYCINEEGEKENFRNYPTAFHPHSRWVEALDRPLHRNLRALGAELLTTYKEKIYQMFEDICARKQPPEGKPENPTLTFLQTQVYPETVAAITRSIIDNAKRGKTR